MVKKVAILFALILIPTAALAHSGDASLDSSERDQIMWMMEDHMMGDEQHERMEELMEKLIEGTLSEIEQQEMIQLMQDPETGPGVMTMMMRFMNPQWNTWYGPGMMGFSFGSFTYWITLALVWVLLVMGIVVLGKKLHTKK